MLLKNLKWIPILFLFWNCNNDSAIKGELIDFVPENASVVLTISNTNGDQTGVESFRRDIRTNSLLSALKNTRPYLFFSEKGKFLEHIRPISESLISLNHQNDSTTIFTFLTKEVEGLLVVDSTKNISFENLTDTNSAIRKINIDGEIMYSTSMDSVFIASSSREELERILDGYTNKDPDFKRIAKIKTSKGISAIFKNNNVQVSDSSYVNFATWMALGMDILPDAIKATGVSMARDTVPQLLSVFKGLVPQTNEMDDIIPANGQSAMMFTFNDAELLHKNLLAFNKKDTLQKVHPLFESINEIGLIELKEGKAIVLKSIDPQLTNESILRYRTEKNSFREITLYDFTKETLFEESFTPLIIGVTPTISFQLDDFFIFTSNENVAQSIISAYKNNATLANMSFYKEINEELSSASSLSFYRMNGNMAKVLPSFFYTWPTSEIDKISFKNHPFAALQFSHDRDFAHVNLICKDGSTNTTVSEGVKQQFSVHLDNEILSGPQFFSNHRTGGKDIVVQDISNKLYLISDEGKVLWTKDLPDPIIGPIHEVDILRNGKKQLAFVTESAFYVLDRNGNSVGDFPLKFRDKITQPLSVFDYDNNRKYRFVITQGNDILMYDSKGSRIKGFTFKKTSSPVVLPPQHIRFGSKDYILIAEQNGTLRILNRIGKDRIKVSKKFNFSTIPIAEEDSKFVVITQENTKESISQTGKVSSQKLDVSGNYYFTTLGKTKATLDDNILRINGKKVELPLGIYSQPTIFSVNRKIYITITESQEKKVYLFDSSGNSNEGFPVYGSNSADIGTSSKNKGILLVVQGEAKEVVLYTKH